MKTREKNGSRGPVSAVGSGHRRGVDLDEDLAVLRCGALDVLESLDLGRPVSVVHNRFHAFTSSRSFAVVAGAGAPGHGEHDVPRLLAGLDVLARLDHVLERVAPVDDRAVLPRLDELFQEEDVLLRVAGDPHRDLLLSDPLREQREQRDVPHEPRVGRDVDPARLQRAPAAPERLLADGVEDHVVELAALGEVLVQVVDDLVGPERAHELDVLRVADGRDVRAGVLGQLHPGGADGSGRAVDEHARALADVRLPQAREREARPVADGGSLVEAHSCGLVCEHARLADADELGVRAGADAEDLVPDRELRDVCAGGLDHARELEAESLLLRPAEPGEEAADEELGAAQPGIRARDRRRVDLHEDLVRSRGPGAPIPRA